MSAGNTAGITLAQAEAKLAVYLAAEEKILLGQKVEIDGESLTRADLEFVQKGVETWNARVITLTQTSQGRSRARTLSPGW